MKLTRTEEVAVLIVSSLVGQTSPVSLSEISVRHGVSQPFLKKITRTLKSAGILQAKEGVGGGYFLARSPDQLTLADIFQHVSGGVSAMPNQKTLSSCPLKKDCLPFEIRRCINRVMIQALSHMKISQILSLKEHA